MAKLKELQKKKRREKRRKRREAKKALEEGERKTLKAMVELWVEAHPTLLEDLKPFFGEKRVADEASLNIVSLIEKKVLKLEMTEYSDSDMVRLRMHAKDPNTGEMSRVFPTEIILLLFSILPVILVSSTIWMSVFLKLGSGRVLTMMNMTAERSVR